MHTASEKTWSAIPYLALAGMLGVFVNSQGQDLWDRTGRDLRWNSSTYLSTNNHYLDILQKRQWSTSNPVRDLTNQMRSLMSNNDRYNNILFENQKRFMDNQLRLLDNQTRLLNMQLQLMESQMRLMEIRTRQMEYQMRTMEDLMMKTATYSLNATTFELFPSVRDQLNTQQGVPLDPRRFLPTINFADLTYPEFVAQTNPFIKATWKTFEKYNVPMERQLEFDFQSGKSIDPYSWADDVNRALKIYKWSGILVSDISTTFQQGKFDILRSKSMAAGVEYGYGRLFGEFFKDRIKRNLPGMGAGMGDIAKAAFSYAVRGAGGMPTVDEAAGVLDGLNQMAWAYVGGAPTAAIANAAAHFGRWATYPIFEDLFMSPVRKQYISNYVDAVKRGYTGSIQDFYTPTVLQQVGFNPYGKPLYGTDIGGISSGLRNMNFDPFSYSRNTSYSYTFSSYTNNWGNTFTRMSGWYSTTTQNSWFRQTTSWSFKNYYTQNRNWPSQYYWRRP